MNKQRKPTFSPEFRLKAAQLVVDRGHSVRETADAMGVGKSTMERFFRSLKTEWIPALGYRNFMEAKHAVTDYLDGYYSQTRPHQHNHGLSPNTAEQLY